MRAKLSLSADLDQAVVSPLVSELIEQLQQSHVDYTSFFRSLAAAARGDAEPARGLFLDIARFDDWSARWLALGPDAAAMDRVNPVYIPRNHLVEEALAAATDGDLDPLGRLLDAVTSPYDERDGFERYAEGAPVDFGDDYTWGVPAADPPRGGVDRPVRRGPQNDGRSAERMPGLVMAVRVVLQV